MHINHLKKAIAAFISTGPYHLESTLSADASEELWSLVVDPIPWEIECIAADALHNLRTPLDKMLSAAFPCPDIHVDDANPQAITFPARNNVMEVENALTRLRRHLKPPVVDFVRKSQPYVAGAGQTFWAINKLDNLDKHRALLKPIKFGFSTAEHRQIQAYEGHVLRIGSRRGRHLIPVPDARPGEWHMHQPNPELAPILRLSPATVSDYFLEFTSPNDDMEILTTTPGTKVVAEIKPSLSIAFGDIEGLGDKPVIKVLETMRDAVVSLLEGFALDFFPDCLDFA